MMAHPGIISQSTVDDETWYTVRVTPAVSLWVQKTYPGHRELWSLEKYAPHFAVLNVHEQVLTMMLLRWS
jgi:hypothetical protein